jgi:hypothetical protein
MKCDHCHVLQLHAAAARQRRQLEAVQRGSPGLPGFAGMNMMSSLTAHVAIYRPANELMRLCRGLWRMGNTPAAPPAAWRPGGR